MVESAAKTAAWMVSCAAGSMGLAGRYTRHSSVLPLALEERSWFALGHPTKEDAGVPPTVPCATGPTSGCQRHPPARRLCLHEIRVEGTWHCQVVLAAVVQHLRAPRSGACWSARLGRVCSVEDRNSVRKHKASTAKRRRERCGLSITRGLSRKLRRYTPNLCQHETHRSQQRGQTCHPRDGSPLCGISAAFRR